MRLLLVEDDADLSASLKGELERIGFAVDMAQDGERGEYLGMTETYNLIILDLGLPKLPGLDALRSWRQAGNHVPVIVLTARDAWYEKVDGFNAGADDYLGKPFHIEELVARIQALLKRLHGRSISQLQYQHLRLSDEQQCVFVADQLIELTAVEFRLLRYFMLHPGQVLTKMHLLEHVYDIDHDPDSNVIEVYINRLRQKVGKDLITTRRGQGYVFGRLSECH
jgi:two-component system OmpR family response regulator